MKHGNKIRISLNYQQLHKRTLKALFDFCFTHSDTVSLSQLSNIGMTKDEAEHATAAYYEYLNQNGMEEGRRPSLEEMIVFYQDIAESEEELKELIGREKDARNQYDSRFKKSDLEAEGYMRSLFTGYQLSGREVTCMTPCTMGGPCIMYYLRPEEKLKADFYRMEELFQPVMEDESVELRLEDPVFYVKGELLLLVCTHEKYASFQLTEEQYEEFKSLGIPHSFAS